MYLRIPKEITKKEAILLISIVEDTKATVFSSGRSWDSCHDVSIFDEELVALFIDELPNGFDDQQVIKAIVNCMECPGVWLSYIAAFSNNAYQVIDYWSYDVFERETRSESSIQVLENLGLVKRFKLTDIRYRERKDVSFWIDGVMITDLGYSFYQAVNQTDYQKTFKIFVNRPDDHRQIHEAIVPEPVLNRRP